MRVRNAENKIKEDGKLVKYIDIILILVMLVWTGAQDIKNGEINIVIPLGIAGIDLLVRLFCGRIDAADVFEGAAIGAAVMVLSVMTKESIGMGDGVILLCTGAMSGFEKNMELFFSALILCGMCGLFLVLVLRKSRKTKVPFVPFLLVAFGIMEMISLSSGVLL